MSRGIEDLPVRSVAENSDDCASLALLPRQLGCGPDVERTAGADVQPFLVQQTVDHTDALAIRDMNGSAEKLKVRLQVIRHTTLSDPLSNAAGPYTLGLAVLYHIVQHRSGRIGEPSLDTAVGLLRKVAGDTGQRTACAGRANECIEFAAVGLFPDFRAGGEDMRIAVGGVVELVGPYGVVERVGVPLRLVVVVLRVVKCHSCGISSLQPLAMMGAASSPGTGRTSAPSIRRRSIFS